ncbi:MAG TPA: ClpXP protease specificity-enhancing factor SspB [Magnetospirillaceae bacterium]|jgi:hypothetical protein
MASGVLRYDRMVEDALKGVLRAALKASEQGLPGDHHFYITFRTGHPGVSIAEHLHARYPGEMTIVIQHQYWGLEVDEQKFAVTLSFNRVNERLVIPFAAVTAFADPSAKFGLQFQGTATGETDAEVVPLPDAPASNEIDDKVTSVNPPPQPATGTADASGERGQVIALDAFRKK